MNSAEWFGSQVLESPSLGPGHRQEKVSHLSQTLGRGGDRRGDSRVLRAKVCDSGDRMGNVPICHRASPECPLAVGGRAEEAMCKGDGAPSTGSTHCNN